MPAHRKLLDLVLAAFKQAIADERLDAAEHLLLTLELLESEALPGPLLNDAYLMIAHGNA